MAKAEYMSWENFSKAIIVEEEQRTYKVSESPRVDFFWDGRTKSVGVLLETTPDTVLTPELLRLTSVALDITKRSDIHFLKIVTTSEPLRRQFYHFGVAVSERLLSGTSNALDAVTTELAHFGELLAERATLSSERQIGLLGELLFLERLIVSKGVQTLDCWVGPQSEPHDFRLELHEFEVKTTTKPRRVHVIHGAEQLVPSRDCHLYILSIVLGPPGGAGALSFSLAEKIRDLQRLFQHDGLRGKRFLEALDAVGVRMGDLVYYGRTYSLRRPLAVIPVDAQIPALTRPAIQLMFGPSSQRVESIEYALDLEGLEHEEGSHEFKNIIPL